MVFGLVKTANKVERGKRMPVGITGGSRREKIIKLHLGRYTLHVDRPPSYEYGVVAI